MGPGWTSRAWYFHSSNRYIIPFQLDTKFWIVHYIFSGLKIKIFEILLISVPVTGTDYFYPNKQCRFGVMQHSVAFHLGLHCLPKCTHLWLSHQTGITHYKVWGNKINIKFTHRKESLSYAFSVNKIGRLDSFLKSKLFRL